MPLIVSDTSSAIDLRKAGLLRPLLELPFTIAMPDLLFEDAFLCFSDEEKTSLCRDGLEVRTLSGEFVARAQEHRNRYCRLKLADCFALTLAELEQGSILLAGDILLKEVAMEHGVEAHCALWAIDRMEEHAVAEGIVLQNALRLFLDDDLVFLPQREILRRLRHLVNARFRRS